MGRHIVITKPALIREICARLKERGDTISESEQMHLPFKSIGFLRELCLDLVKDPVSHGLWKKQASIKMAITDFKGTNYEKNPPPSSH